MPHSCGMAQTVPNCEPTRITAGDTIAWTRSLADFPASAGWVLSYRLINALVKIDITAAASGDDHAVSVSAATSAGYTSGKYAWQAVVTKTTERYTVGTGALVIDPNLAAEASGYDTRSSAQKCLDDLDTALATYGNKAYTVEYEIAGRRMKFASPGDFISFRSKIQAEVAREKSAARIAAGESPRNKLLVRFQ